MVPHFREALRLAADPLLRNRAALELATALGLRGEWEEPMRLVESALADLGDQAPELTLRSSRSAPESPPGIDAWCSTSAAVARCCTR